MAKYLITGIAGFVGSSLATELAARGQQIRGIDNFTTGNRQNLDHLTDRIDVLEANMEDGLAIKHACDDVDYVLHHGALPSVPLSIKQPELSHRCNIEGTFNILEAARCAGVKRFIYAGSSSAYGNQSVLPSRESSCPKPISPYAVQKLCGEYYASSYWQVYRFETVSLRYFNIFGPRQSSNSAYSGVIATFIQQMLSGSRPIIYGTGNQARDFTYVDDVVSANLLASQAPAETVAGRIFNIGCGRQHTLNELYEILAGLIGFSHPPIYAPAREGDVLRSQADISSAEEAFGYRPRISFEQGLRQTVKWYSQATQVAGLRG